MGRGPVEIAGHHRVQLLRQFARTVWRCSPPPDRLSFHDPGTGCIPGPLGPQLLSTLLVSWVGELRSCWVEHASSAASSCTDHEVLSPVSSSTPGGSSELSGFRLAMTRRRGHPGPREWV